MFEYTDKERLEDIKLILSKDTTCECQSCVDINKIINGFDTEKAAK